MNELSIVAYMGQEAVSQNIKQTLGAKTPQFIASVASLVNANDALKSADKKSVMLACLTGATLDLPINQNLGFAYIIPYKKDGVNVAQFQMGYKGFIQLAMRSGQFKTINVTDVRKGEIGSKNRLTGEIEFSWIEEDREKLPVIGYVAFMRLINGFEKLLYMTTQELQQHGLKYSKSMKKGFGLWKDEFDMMAKKTVMKLLLSKYAPLTTEMQTAQLADQAVITDLGSYQYFDNEPQEPVDAQEVAEKKETFRIMKFISNAKNLEELKKVETFLTPETQPLYDTRVKALGLEKGGT